MCENSDQYRITTVDQDKLGVINDYSAKPIHCPSNSKKKVSMIQSACPVVRPAMCFAWFWKLQTTLVNIISKPWRITSLREYCRTT